MIKEMVFKGRIILWEVTFVTCCGFVYTVIFHFMPLRVWRYFRFVWTWLLMEYYTKHSADLINNRNVLEELGAHNLAAFGLFLYIETNSNITPAILEGALYGDLGLLDLPYLLYDMAFNYFVAIPLHYILQICLLGASLSFSVPTSLYSVWYHNTHIAGYIPVNEINNTEYDAHWLFCAINAAVFVGLSGYFDVYRRAKFMEDYREEKPAITATADKSETKTKKAGKSQKIKS